MPQFKVNNTYYGFHITKIKESRELNGKCYYMVHEKTGTELFWLDNGAENKVFSIAFKTIPYDNTGVFHILEHTVLCGSEKYPVKEPMVELMKSSMNTFLNALTFPDMTMYPVGSRINRDLLNLTDVYLDAVFHPRSIKDIRIFQQEGWRIENDENGMYYYQGVVLNEMKGAMSDADSIGEREIMKLLFPDNGYGYNSGGDPDQITDLTYEEYLQQYDKNYHPSNAKIYLDGAIPIDEMLSLINSYLDRFEKKEMESTFAKQEPISREKDVEYEIGQEESMANHNQLYIARICGDWTERAKNLAGQIIGEVLTGNNEAPLKRIVLQKKLAQDITMDIDDTTYQSWIVIHAENVADGKEKELREEIQAFADQLDKDGLDHDELEANLNRIVFSLKEEEEPQGIGRCIRSMSSWLYGGDPLSGLENDSVIEEVRSMISDGRINRMAVELLREGEGTCILRLLPSPELGEKRRKEEEKKLFEITGEWSEKQRKKNIRQNNALRKWQETPDSEENLSSLPSLKKEDADIPPAWTETEEMLLSGVPVMVHRIPDNGITHLRMYFSLTDLSLEELIHINLLAVFLGKLPTEKYDAGALQKEIKKVTGRLGFSVICLSNLSDREKATPYLVAYASALNSNIEKTEELMTEILLHSNLDSFSKMKEIVMQIEMSLRQKIIGAGHIIGMRNTLSHFSSEFAVRNALEGDITVRYIHNFAINFDQNIKDFQKTALKVLQKSISKKRLIISITGPAPVNTDILTESMSEGTAVPAYRDYRYSSSEKIGYRIPSQIGFAAAGYHLAELGALFQGNMLLAANIISLSFLWNRVRVLGGAYGSAFQIDRFGNVYFYSYRDPSPARSIEALNDIEKYLKSFAENGESLDNYIISTLNELNPLMSDREAGTAADIRYLTGYTREMAEQLRKDILQSKKEDIVKCADWVSAFAEKSAKCIVAHKEALEECEGLEISDL